MLFARGLYKVPNVTQELLNYTSLFVGKSSCATLGFAKGKVLIKVLIFSQKTLRKYFRNGP